MTKKNFGNRVKMAWLKSMEVLGTSASNLADNAKTRANELNYESRRREVLTELSLKAFELWQKGAELPQQLSDMCCEINELDEKLNTLRAQKYARLAAEGKTPPIEADGSVSEPEEAPCESEGDLLPTQTEDAPSAPETPENEPEEQSGDAQ